MTKRVKILTIINNLNIGSSNLICINIVITKYDLIAAIVRAIKSVYCSKFIPATDTVKDVNTNKLTQTSI